MNRRKILSLPVFLLSCASSLAASQLTVDATKPGATINPSMWGVFFEDINFGADGGLSAEMIKNGAFRFPEALMGWSVPATFSAGTALSFESEPGAEGTPFVRFTSKAKGAFENEGYRGMGVTKDENYLLEVKARSSSPVVLRAELLAQGGAVIASTELRITSDNWELAKAVLKSDRTDTRAHLRLSVQDPASFDVTNVSLLPEKTWKGSAKGLRADMVQALADFGPGFVRFPGGCIVEGPTLDLRYQWKKTIGPVEKRTPLYNRWNKEFKHRAAPDYYQSFRVGFLEYFQLCEDLRSEPLPILNCGMACQYNSGELAQTNALDSYIQDALDLIEFANGPVTTQWGAKRAELGHPEPFHLKWLGVGNEQWGPNYMERFERFKNALKAAHPEIQLIAAAGPSPAGEHFNLAWKRLPEIGTDLIDEHCYDKPDWFFDNAHRFDSYDRNGPKVFMGEYAAQSDAPGNGILRNTWRCALSEAAFMTGMERNADVVRLASYAPLFSHIDAWQWAPDMIWADNLRTVLTPSYHVQRLYAQNRGDRVLPLVVKHVNEENQKRSYASAVLDSAKHEIIVKLVNATNALSTEEIEIAGAKSLAGGEITTLHADDPLAINSFDAPSVVAPKTRALPASDTNKISVALEAGTFAVVRLRLP